MRRVRFLNRIVTLALVAALFGANLINATPRRSALTNQLRSEIAFGPSVQVRAIASSNGALVEWSTSFDSGALGFNVFRVRNGSRTQINPSLIAGGVLIVKRTQLYSWFDANGTVDCEYEVQLIDLQGESAASSLAKPLWSRTPVANQQSLLLSRLGAERNVSIQAVLTDSDQVKSERSNSAEAVSTASLADQWAIANQPALKIGVRSSGWYHITQPELAAAGFDTTGEAANLRLFVSANEIAMRVSHDSGPLGASDFVEFWGEGLDTATTDTQVYWLVNGSQPGKRIAIKAELHTLGDVPVQAPPPATTSNAIVAARFWFPNLAILVAATPQSVTNDQVREAKSRSREEPKIVSSNTLPAQPAAETKPTTFSNRSAERSRDFSPRSASSRSTNKSPSSDRKDSPGNAEKFATVTKRINRRNSRRRNRRKPARFLRRHNHAALAATPAPAFTYSVQRKDRTVYYSAALNGDQENYFGAVVFGDGPLVTVNLHNIEPTSSAPAQLQVALQGVSVESHQVKVFINGSLVGTMVFADQDATTQTFSIPNSWLIEGDNIVKLAPVGSSHDTSVIDYLRIVYAHSFRADSDALQFSLRSTLSVRVEGFSTSNIRVLDLSDTSNVQEVDPIVEASSGAFAATIPAGARGKARRLIALPTNRISQPAWLSLNQPSTLNRSSNAADFLIISHKDFIPTLAPLVAQRQAQGFTVTVADVENIFDEFSYGLHTPQALRDFISLAKTTWSRSPSYVLLVGDASYDPRNYSGAGNLDFVPTKEIDTGIPSAATALETASDDWFTDFNGDGIADISIGRLPVRTPAEATLVVSKIVNYAPANTPQRAMLVADAQGSYYFNFEAADDQVGATLPASMPIQRVYRRLQASDADARANIISNFNSGQAVTVYSGHGNVNIWGGSIFSSNDASALANGNRLPFVVVMDCLNGYFADPSLQSLAESLVKAPNGGAVASFASSGLTIPDGQHEMGLKMFQLLYGGSSIAIGDASRQAKVATSDMDVRRTWILFGDPSMKIR
ncbi:MAG: hypothetical protein DMF72_13090 [Acidobacteria bacterium]|nr:MAG: hypothetical protein DMF72_13090 [Acidobacteriota bacterium]